MQPTSLLLAKENSSKVNKPLATDLWSSHEEYKKVSFVASRAESKEHELKRLICLVQSLGSLTKLRKGSSNTQRDLGILHHLALSRHVKSNH